MLNLASFLFTLGLGYYLICALQWFNYSFFRIIFHYTRPLWHIYFAILPYVVFGILALNFQEFALIFSLAYLLSLYFWQRKITQKLVITQKIKRFFIILAFVSLINFYFASYALIFGPLTSLLITFIFMFLIEKIIFNKFKNLARKNIAKNPDLKIILITASFGKTSMKNFLYELLKDDFKVQFSPRSVNTLKGIIKDINENLSYKTQIYIAEAGARSRGDIDEITSFLNPHFVIVGQLGLAHLEYFKSFENIKKTKLEALNSSRLKKAFLHSSTGLKSDDKKIIYDEFLLNSKASLEGLEFVINLNKQKEVFKTPLLGKFNALNLTAVILMANELGVNLENIKKAISNLQNVEHRLQKIEAGGKVILDDSFNGNFNGMKESYELANTFEGRKILLTPGIVEAGDEDNEKLSKIINEVFDLVVITSALNLKTLSKFVDKDKLEIMLDKSKIQEFLAKNTRSGDLILFSNDAPDFM